MNKRDQLIQEIKELAKEDPVIHASIRGHEQGCSTWEEAMMIAIKVLVIQKNALEKELVQAKHLSIQPMIFGIDFGKGKSKTVKVVFRKDENGLTVLDHIESEEGKKLTLKLLEPENIKR